MLPLGNTRNVNIMRSKTGTVCCRQASTNTLTGNCNLMSYWFVSDQMLRSSAHTPAMTNWLGRRSLGGRTLVLFIPPPSTGLGVIKEGFSWQAVGGNFHFSSRRVVSRAWTHSGYLNGAPNKLNIGLPADSGQSASLYWVPVKGIAHCVCVRVRALRWVLNIRKSRSCWRDSGATIC